MSKLSGFEATARRLIEGTFARAFGGGLRPAEIATQIAHAIEKGRAVQPDGSVQAPTHYWVYLNREDRESVSQGHPTLANELADQVNALAAESDMLLPTPPVIYVMTDPELKAREIKVEARWLPGAVTAMDRTRELLPQVSEDQDREESAAPPGRPFLIAEGRRHISLLAPIIAVGRSLDNTVILEDLRVSRHHAQLRHRYGRYVLYDLSGSGGTRINGYQVEECVLHSGDVISLGGIEVIYGEDPLTPYPLPIEEDTPYLPADRDTDR